jgi:hypothetical protein
MNMWDSSVSSEHGLCSCPFVTNPSTGYWNPSHPQLVSPDDRAHGDCRLGWRDLRLWRPVHRRRGQVCHTLLLSCSIGPSFTSLRPSLPPSLPPHCRGLARFCGSLGGLALRMLPLGVILGPSTTDSGSACASRVRRVLMRQERGGETEVEIVCGMRDRGSDCHVDKSLKAIRLH